MGVWISKPFFCASPFHSCHWNGIKIPPSPTNNALLTNFLLSSDAGIFAANHRLSMQIGAKRAKKRVRDVYVFRLSFHFCMPPLVVGMSDQQQNYKSERFDCWFILQPMATTAPRLKKKKLIPIWEMPTKSSLWWWSSNFLIFPFLLPPEWAPGGKLHVRALHTYAPGWLFFQILWDRPISSPPPKKKTKVEHPPPLPTHNKTS